MTVGSGIGGALIIDDRIYRGFGQGAGEIGHLHGPGRGRSRVSAWSSSSKWPPAGPSPGPAGSWPSGRLAGHLAGARSSWIGPWPSPGQITGLAVAQAARKGDARALAILDRARRALAFALAQAIALVAPRRIVIGGGVSLIGEELWFEPIRRLVDATSSRPSAAASTSSPPPSARKSSSTEPWLSPTMHSFTPCRNNATCARMPPVT